MKNTLKILSLLLVIALFAVSVTALAVDTVITLDGFTFSVNENNEAVIHEYDNREEDVVVPEKLLDAIGADRKVLLVMPEKNDMVVASARNIPGVKTALVNTLNVYDIVNADKFVVVKDAVAQIEEVYC